MIDGKHIQEALERLGSTAGTIKHAVSNIEAVEKWLAENQEHDAAEPIRALADSLGATITGLATLVR